MTNDSAYQAFIETAKSLRETLNLHLEKLAAAKKMALANGEMETAVHVRDFEKKLLESRDALFPVL